MDTKEVGQINMSNTSGSILSYLFSLFIISCAILLIVFTLHFNNDFSVRYTIEMEHRTYNNCTLLGNVYYDSNNMPIDFGGETPKIFEKR